MPGQRQRMILAAAGALQEHDEYDAKERQRDSAGDGQPNNLPLPVGWPKSCGRYARHDRRKRQFLRARLL